MPKTPTKRPLAAFVSLLWPALFLALSSTAHAYLGANEGFDDDLAGWTQSGSWSHEPADGLLLSPDGSAEASGAGIHTLSQCVDITSVSANRSVVVIANVKSVGHQSPVSAAIELHVSTDCTDGAPTGTATDQRSALNPDVWSTLFVSTVRHDGFPRARITVTVDHSSARGPNPVTRVDLAAARHDLISGGNFFAANYVDAFSEIAGTWSWVNDGFSQPAGAAEGSVDTAGAGGDLWLQQCNPLSAVPATTDLFSILRAKAEDISGGGWGDGEWDYVVTYQFYPNANCTGGVMTTEFHYIEPGATDQWWQFSKFVPVPSGAASVTANLYLSSDGKEHTTGSTITIEDWVLAVGEPMIFADGFESGNTLAWQ